VKVPPAMEGGAIVFRDPRGPAVAMYETPGIELPWVGSGTGIPFAPATGHLLLFPSWLEHRVEPFAGSGERISIAFNVRNP
jgi:Putative 2OG-Fe(II) oxygenase